MKKSKFLRYLLIGQIFALIGALIGCGKSIIDHGMVCSVGENIKFFLLLYLILFPISLLVSSIAFLVLEWERKKKIETIKILAKTIKEAEKNKPKKTLLTHIIFGLVTISFFILGGLIWKDMVVKNQTKSYQLLFFASSFIFTQIFFMVVYITKMKELSKKDMKYLKK